MNDVVYLRGNGGGIFEMTLPLSEPHQKQYAAGDLVRVNPDGSTFEEVLRPRRARKAKDDQEEPDDA